MTSLRRFTANDLFKINRMYCYSFTLRNLDPLTENVFLSSKMTVQHFILSAVLGSMARIFLHCHRQSWTRNGLQYSFNVMQVMGKAEGKDKEWHGHVTALTVGPQYRRVGLADQLMKLLEDITVNKWKDL